MKTKSSRQKVRISTLVELQAQAIGDLEVLKAMLKVKTTRELIELFLMVINYHKLS